MTVRVKIPSASAITVAAAADSATRLTVGRPSALSTGQADYRIGRKAKLFDRGTLVFISAYLKRHHAARRRRPYGDPAAQAHRHQVTVETCGLESPVQIRDQIGKGLIIIRTGHFYRHRVHFTR